MKNYYAILGVAPDASPAAIRKSYRRLAKTCHPDLHAGDAAMAQRFIALTEAYTTLSDAEARARYDAEATGAFAPPPQPAADWPQGRKPFGKHRASRPAPSRPRVEKAHPLFTRADADDVAAVFLAIARSPVTYCLLAVFLMLLAIRETLGALGHPHP